MKNLTNIIFLVFAFWILYRQNAMVDALYWVRLAVSEVEW
jgi:hypothetical protein